MNKSFLDKIIVLLLIGLIFFAGCGKKEIASSKSTGKEDYENQVIVIEGAEDGDKKITVAEMRKLDQKELKASLTRTTGLLEEFKAAGPTVKDVLTQVGVNIEEYEGLGFIGRDGYYCLVVPEIVENYELILALAVDDNPELPTDTRPARLCVQGEFGPYWVRMLDKIILHKKIPQKDINSVWMFKNLAEGIEPYPYEYYGSKDDSIELAQVFSRFDNINYEAFFTMKSADGFLKNESMNVVGQMYYIKIDGEGSPMNISPHIKLGMNVKNIAWFSTNADAAIFPEQMERLLEQTEIGNLKGVLLGDIFEEVRVRNIEDKSFEIIDMSGESFKINGSDLYRGILTVDGGNYSVVWDESEGLPLIKNLLCIKTAE